MRLIENKKEATTLAGGCNELIKPEKLTKMLKHDEAIKYCHDFFEYTSTRFGFNGSKIYKIDEGKATAEFDDLEDLEETFIRKNREMDTELHEAQIEERTEAIMRVAAEADLDELKRYKMFIDYEIEKKKGNNPPNPFTMENLWYR